MNLPDSFNTMFATVSKKILILVLAAAGFFLVQPGSAKATLCSDTYGGAEGMSCQPIESCAGGDYEKGIIKSAWETKKVGWYKQVIGGVQAGDYYITNVYNDDGSAATELCPVKDLGQGIQLAQVCCKWKGPSGAGSGSGAQPNWCFDPNAKSCSAIVPGGTCVSGKIYSSETECIDQNKPEAPAATGSGASKANDGSSFIPKKPDGYAGPLPDCAFDGTCRNVNDVLELMVKWGQRIFGLIGTFALVMFVYGGFVMILSAGNSDKVKQGRDILTAAVIGLVIAFSAYLLIDFVLDALNVSEEFRGVNLDV